MELITSYGLGFPILNFKFSIPSSFLYSTLVFLYFCVSESRTLRAPPSSDDSHANRAPTPEVARLNGYRCDIHTVQTVDGYILQVHRFPGGRGTPLNCSLPPVLLMHGVVLSSVVWVTTGPTQALAYLLADQGYDVWLGNTRGNVYSRSNVHFSVDEDQFWDFSWEDAAQLDLPAVIDYILATTSHKQILYVGHSMGTTQFFVLCSLRPEYNKKVQHMVALAPVAYLTYTNPLLRFIVSLGDIIFPILQSLRHGEYSPRNSLMNNYFEYICSLKVNEVMCENMLFRVFGYDHIGFNQSVIPFLYGQTPAGGSVKTLQHFGQVILSERFQRFDYGTVKNLALYNSASPPEFNLSRITVPLSFFYSDNDILANTTFNLSQVLVYMCYFYADNTAISDPKDIMHLVNQLTVKVDVYRVNLTSFNHIDYFTGKNLKFLLNDKIISILRAKQTLSKNTSCGP